LATTHKVRSCSAVALDDDSFILVVNAETYNVVLRHHHFRQKQLQTSIAIIQELPLFKNLNESSLTAIASMVKNANFKKKELIVSEGDSIQYVIVIIGGDVKVCKTQKVVHPNEVEGIYIKKKTVVDTLGKGKIIGQLELFKDTRHFEYTYEASTLTETMLIPVTAFLEGMKSIHSKRTICSGSHGGQYKDKKDILSDRTESAFDLIKNLIQLKSNHELVIKLPTIANAPGKQNNNRLTKALLHTNLDPATESTRFGHEGDVGGRGIVIKHDSSDKTPSVISTTYTARKPSSAAPSTLPSTATRRSFITKGGRKLSFSNATVTSLID